MTIYETDVPGVGHKFELELDGERRLVVLIHHDGTRELYVRPDEDADSEKIASLPGKLARQLGSILEGAHFQPVELDETTVPLGEAIIEWVEVDPSSALVGKSLQTADIREEAGVSVLAVQRGEDTIANPDSSTIVEAGDILVVLGTREEHETFSELFEAGDDATDET